MAKRQIGKQFNDVRKQVAHEVQDLNKHIHETVNDYLVEHRFIESKKKQDDEDMGAFVVGALVGGLLGAAAAIWFAPQSGRETRHEITSKSEELVDRVEHAAQDTRRRIEGESISDSLQLAKAEARRFQEQQTTGR